MDAWTFGLAVALLGLPPLAAVVAWLARGAWADDQLALERDRRERAEQRAADAERQRDALLSASRDYMAAVPVGSAVLPRDRLRVLLDLTQHAAGASSPPPSGLDGDGPGVGGVT